jgi:hypothetical protein
MLKAEHRGVQCKTLSGPPGMVRKIGPVPFIPEHRVTGLRKMDANLVALSRLQIRRDPSCALQTLLDPEMRHGPFPLLTVALLSRSE